MRNHLKKEIHDVRNKIHENSGDSASECKFDPCEQFFLRFDLREHQEIL